LGLPKARRVTIASPASWDIFCALHNALRYFLRPETSAPCRRSMNLKNPKVLLHYQYIASHHTLPLAQRIR
jgi:hypothetical protein